jgi:hypothetical protein
VRAIARRLARSPATVCRAVAANGGLAGTVPVPRTGGRSGGRGGRSRRSWRCARGCARWWRASWGTTDLEMPRSELSGRFWLECEAGLAEESIDEIGRYRPGARTRA